MKICLSRMHLHENKCMGGCYEIEAWWSDSDHDSYYFKFELSAFIRIRTGLVDPLFALILQKASTK